MVPNHLLRKREKRSIMSILDKLKQTFVKQQEENKIEDNQTSLFEEVQ